MLYYQYQGTFQHLIFKNALSRARSGISRGTTRFLGFGSDRSRVVHARGNSHQSCAEAGRIIRTTHRGGPARQGASPSLRGTLRTRCGVDGGSVWRCRVPARLGDELLGAPTRLVRNGSARRGVPSSALAAVGAGSGARAGRSACGVSPTPGRSSSRSCVLYACAQAFWGA